jgi:beta-N-acetylhexosaminidase
LPRPAVARLAALVLAMGMVAACAPVQAARPTAPGGAVAGEVGTPARDATTEPTATPAATTPDETADPTAGPAASSEATSAPASDRTATPDPEPTPTPDPTRAPDATATRAPAGTAEPTASPSPTATPALTATPTPPTDEPTLAELVGQRVIVRMDGTRPSSSLLARVRRGEVGGIVLFGSVNVTTKPALRSAVRALKAAARDGGQPPLLVMADQEGGSIRTIPWAPPAESARAMGSAGTAASIRERGAATGQALLASGVNVDLAPVADVAAGRSGFMYRAGRTFSRSSAVVTRLSVAFAKGLRSAGVIPVMKHFPGIGRVRLNTDRSPQAVTAGRTAMEADLRPFRAAVAAGMPVVMLSNATYIAWDSKHAAGWSRAIAVDLLRTQLGFRGVSITDSLNGTAHSRGTTARALAWKAMRAGVDMVMFTSRESTTDSAFDYLVARAKAGAIPADELRAAYDRVVALKRTLVP